MVTIEDVGILLSPMYWLQTDFMSIHTYLKKNVPYVLICCHGNHIYSARRPCMFIQSSNVAQQQEMELCKVSKMVHMSS